MVFLNLGQILIAVLQPMGEAKVRVLHGIMGNRDESDQSIRYVSQPKILDDAEPSSNDDTTANTSSLVLLQKRKTGNVSVIPEQPNFRAHQLYSIIRWY